MRTELAIILTDANRRIQWVNKGFTDITGYELKDVWGKKPSILQGENSEPAVINEIRSALNATLPIKTIVTNYRKNGEEYPCELYIQPVFNIEKELTNFIAFEVDYNESKLESIPWLEHQERYSTSNLTMVQELDLYDSIQQLMQDKKPYLVHSYKLPDLAKELNTNTRYVSQVINNQTGNNFFYFINYQRIESFKTLVKTDMAKKLTLFGIAQKCGFSSKSTFYRAFKQIEGISPFRFLKDHQIDILTD